MTDHDDTGKRWGCDYSYEEHSGFGVFVAYTPRAIALASTMALLQKSASESGVERFKSALNSELASINSMKSGSDVWFDLSVQGHRLMRDGILRSSRERGLVDRKSTMKWKLTKLAQYGGVALLVAIVSGLLWQLVD